MKWEVSAAKGKSGWVQCRLFSDEYPYLEMASIEFHAPIYYVNITRHVKGYVESQLNKPIESKTLDEAKAYAVALVRLS